MFKASALPEADRVYGIPELLGCIFVHCDWRTVMCLSRVDPIGRSGARWEVQQRIRLFLHPFVDAPHFDSFLSLLTDTEAGVAGSVVRRLLAYKSDYDRDIPPNLSCKLATSHDINILVHTRHASAWVDWFESLGYGGWRYIPVYEGYASSVESVMLAIFPRLGKKVSVLFVEPALN